MHQVVLFNPAAIVDIRTTMVEICLDMEGKERSLNNHLDSIQLCLVLS